MNSHFNDIVQSAVANKLVAADSWQRLGLITLSTDLTTERDYRQLIPSEGIGLYTSRVLFENPTTADNLKLMAPRLTAAAALLPSDQALTAICYSCTAASVVIGDNGIKKAIASYFPDTPVITPSSSAVKAFQAMGAQKISVLTPYLAQTCQPIAEYFTEHGFDICSFHCLGMKDDREMARVSVDTIIDAAVKADHPTSEALFISCTALPAIHAIAEVERITGKPVVTSNQATAWMMLQYANNQNFPQNFGRLFHYIANIH